MSWGDGKPKPWQVLQMVIGDATCPHCLNPKDSPLHHEICEVNAYDATCPRGATAREAR